ncbi:autotransporter outer membrane beta-barrel domain-containing protein [Massilia sp. PAMC28688]|nr:autotransporter outer membrane beta-barrel domain-containing protein [Massilia sp. PAMC28688]
MMPKLPRQLRYAALAALLPVSLAHGQTPATPPVQAQLADLQRQLTEQRELIDALRRDLAGRAAPPVLPDALQASRGTGKPPATDPGIQGAQSLPLPFPAAPARPALALAQGPRQARRSPTAAPRPPAVAPLFEQPGVLTPQGKLVLEPALQFGYSSSNRVALVGYTIIPALLIGLVDVREVKRNTTTAIFGARYGVSKRLEVEAKLPYVYRSDATVSREIFTGTAVENVFSTSGKHVGDAEAGLRLQLNRGGPNQPFYVGSLRWKSRTGRDPFSVVTDCARRCIGPNASGTGLPLDLPTGSGFHAIQAGLTWLFPSDPAVFFGSVSYLHNFRRNNVSRTVLGGEKEFLGDVKAGDIAGFNIGVGLGLNEQAALSLGYDHSTIGRTRQDGVPVAGSVRTQLGTLLLGMSYRSSERRSINVSVGAGLTRDTPDVSLTVRMPTSF